MKYSILKSTELLLENFESIDKIKIIYTKKYKSIIIYLNNKYCDYDTTIKDIKKMIKSNEFKYCHFVM